LASEDIATAEYAVSREIFRQACFHAQQATEEALKGFLTARTGTHPRGHNLERLLLADAKVHAELRAWRGPCQDLDQYYLATRYADAVPEHGDEPTREEAEKAVGDAKGIVADVRRRLGPVA
jgi:HEPN domain-containing protein